ncbi:MAG: DEAD/DEAH box helicase [bacterium]|nr:DEAD/DEAH box helicase [bacterium]
MMQGGDTTLRIRFERGTLLLDTPDPTALKKWPKDISLKYDPRVPVWRCDAIHYTAVRDLALRSSYQLDDTVGMWRDVSWSAPNLPTPRPEQKEAVSRWLEEKRGVIVMPTGTGKTEVALTIMKELAVSTLIVAPVRDLMYQWHRRILQGLGYNAGIIGDNTFNVCPVSVTTYDSAYIHMDQYLGVMFKLIIFDECHHLPGTNRREAALMSAAPMRMGLTATPERSDGREKDLDRLIGPQVYNLAISDVRGGTLADYEVMRIPVHLSQPEQERYNTASRCLRDYMARRNREEAGTFDWQDLMAETAVDPDARAAQKAHYVMKSIQDRAAEKLRVLEDIFRLHLGEPVIIFTGSNVMARDISCRFLIPCLLNHCKKRERLDILDGLRDGIYPALVANQVLDEGVDIPEAKVAVVVGGGASSRQAKQRLGRILRKSGNKRGILYEIVCEDTSEVRRSRQRRKSDAYEGTRHSRI